MPSYGRGTTFSTKPWRTGAVKAKYHKIANSYDPDTIEFMYVLENTTSQDYRIDDPKDVHLALIVGDSRSLGPVTKFVDLDTPVYIPSKHTAEIVIKLKANPKAALKTDPSDDDQNKYRQAVKKFLINDLSGLNGFSLLDDRNRYEIPFPPGWKESTLQQKN